MGCPHHVTAAPQGFVKLGSGGDASIHDGAKGAAERSLVHHGGEAGDYPATHESPDAVGSSVSGQFHAVTQHLPWDSGVLFKNCENFSVNCIYFYCFRSHIGIVRRFSAIFAVAHWPYSKHDFARANDHYVIYCS
jgi:hypothetical protein